MRECPPFRLDAVNQYRSRGDDAAEERILLAPKAFAVRRYLVELRYLVAHPGRLVTHDDLPEAPWPRTCVQPEMVKSVTTLGLRRVGRRAAFNTARTSSPAATGCSIW